MANNQHEAALESLDILIRKQLDTADTLAGYSEKDLEVFEIPPGVARVLKIPFPAGAAAAGATAAGAAAGAQGAGVLEGGQDAQGKRPRIDDHSTTEIWRPLEDQRHDIPVAKRARNAATSGTRIEEDIAEKSEKTTTHCQVNVGQLGLQERSVQQHIPADREAAGAAGASTSAELPLGLRELLQQEIAAAMQVHTKESVAQVAATMQASAEALQASKEALQASKVAQQELAALRIQINLSSQTTQNEVEIGKVYDRTADLLETTTLPAISADQLDRAKDAITCLLKQWRDTWPAANINTLNEAVHATADQGNVLEKAHMQPLVMKLIEVLGAAVGTKFVNADTHGKDPLGGQGGAIECSLLYGDVRHWPYLVCAIEFKLDNLMAAFGQLITRCRKMFEHQPERTFAYAVGITCSQLQLYRVQCNLHTSAISVARSLPLSLEDAQQHLTADAQGITLLAQVLAANSNDHGFHAPLVPATQHFAGHVLSHFELVRPRRNKVQCAIVYKAKWTHDQQQQPPAIQNQASSVQGLDTVGSGSDASEGSKADSNASCNDCIVKVCVSDKEVKLLQQVGQQPHCVELKATFTLQQQQCVVLQPCVHVFTTAPPLKKLAKLGSDVASAIGALYKVKIYHRDISRNNIGFHEDSGYLFDFSAGKDFGDQLEQRHCDASHPRTFTGTPLFSALCVIKHQPHSVSSDLESLYYSLRHIAYNALPDEGVFRRSGSASDWALVRRGAYVEQQDFKSNEFSEFMATLHKLFWVKCFQCGGTVYWYDKKQPVSVEMFKEVCNRCIGP